MNTPPDIDAIVERAVLAERERWMPALRLVVAYDDLLRTFEGPATDTLFAGDVPVIDAAYDEMVASARACLMED